MTVVAFEIGFESTSFSAGRIVRNGNGTYTVQYHITDHLGSVRGQTQKLIWTEKISIK